MSFSLAKLVTWLIIGLLGGSAAAYVVKRRRKGFGLATNLGLGMVGAVVGGAIFNFFDIFARLDSISVSLRDLLSAFLGSLIVLALVWGWQSYSRRA